MYIIIDVFALLIKFMSLSTRCWFKIWVSMFIFCSHNDDDEQGRINRVIVQIKNRIPKIATDLI